MKALLFNEATYMYFINPNFHDTLFCIGLRTVGNSVENQIITLTHVTLDDAGAYVCVLRNAVGKGTSNAVHVAVIEEHSVPVGTSWEALRVAIFQ